MREQEKPGQTFTHEELAEIVRMGQFFRSALGKRKKEAKQQLSGITKEQHDLLVRWMMYRWGF